MRTGTRTDLVEIFVGANENGHIGSRYRYQFGLGDRSIVAPDPNRPFAALAMVSKTSARWRDIDLTIHSFPNETDLMNLGVFGTGLTFEGAMSALESFRITGPCEMDTSLGKLIVLVRSSKSPQPTTSNFPHVISSTIC